MHQRHENRSHRRYHAPSRFCLHSSGRAQHDRSCRWFLRNEHYLIVDNACVFTAEFERILADAGVKLVRTAIQAPDMNAIAERWVRSIKTECLNKIISFGFTSLERSVNEFVTHYNQERPHQGIGNELIDGSKDSANGEVIVNERHGGLLKHYHRAVA